ncbi:sugar kinase [Algicella marina]|uniref:Sugar kinase n=1 Tax=Algicella marina TaxID=2683284 RepID=A0A6P1SVT0_9RHOB|nr:sugar kinase [Algicella marina]QHQ34784.1 sugar kinase [Algicella marina]
MTRTVAIGECMLEIAPRAEEGAYSLKFAGDTFNTAWYMRKALPQSDTVAYVTAIGSDTASDRMQSFMQASGIDTTHVWRHPERNAGLYLIELEGAERHFSYWRDRSAARTLADDPRRLTAALADAGLVYFSGITLAILSATARETLLAAVAEARAGGATIAFDSNLRPRLWTSGEEMCAAVMAAARHSDIVLPSFDDEASHFGDADIATTAQRYAEAGAGMVVVKNGADGGLIQTGETTQSYAPNTVSDAVDTTAAGDSFNAGFLAAHLAGADPMAAALAGCALAGQVIRKRGALVDIDV